MEIYLVFTLYFFFLLRQVPYEEAEKKAHELNAQFIETSAKTGQNVQEVRFANSLLLLFNC